MNEIKREAGDKTKGFTLQKQRALALCFDELKENPNTHVNVAIEYEGDVYLQYKEEVYVEEQKNYNKARSLSFNSPEILNTLVYFLKIWFDTNQSINIKFGFYSTTKIAKEKSTKSSKELNIDLPNISILKLLIAQNYQENNLLDSISKYLTAEFEKQYKQDISKKIDLIILRSFLELINWQFEMDNEKDFKDKVLEKIQKSEFLEHQVDRFQIEFIYAALMLSLEEKQDEGDILLKFLTRDKIENIFLKVASNSKLTSLKYLDIAKITGEIPKPANYIERHLTKIDKSDQWVSLFDKHSLPAIVKKNIEDKIPVRIIIKATAGQGKSTELDNVAYQIQQEDIDLVPLRLNIKNYNNNLDKFIIAKFSFWEQLEKSNIILLLDSLDEINPDVYQYFLSDFKHLLDSYLNLQVICTIRSNFESTIYNGDTIIFEEYHVHKLFENDILRYIENNSNQSDALKELLEKPWAKNIIYIPFYLSELVKLSNINNNPLPNSLKDFYLIIINSRIDDDFNKYHGRINKEVIFNSIKKIAVFMTLQGLNSIKLEEAKHILNLPNIDLQTNPFFSISENGIEKYLNFVHNNFQEFLTALWMADLEWHKMKSIIFNSENGFLNAKLLNTTVLLFSILDIKDRKYTNLLESIKKTDYTILFYLEKELIPLSERLSYFKKFIEDGKNKNIAYLAGDFDARDIVTFIDYDRDGLTYIIDELTTLSSSSNHLQSVLYIISEFSIGSMSIRTKSIIRDLMSKYIIIPGFNELEYREMIDIISQLGFFDKNNLNSIIKRCPLIDRRYIFSRVIELIHDNKIHDQFEYVLNIAMKLSSDNENRSYNYERTFSKYIFENLNESNYTLLLQKIANDKDYKIKPLLNELEFFEPDPTKYIDKIYIKLAAFANDKKASIDVFIQYLNTIKYDYASNTEYGSPQHFFNNLKKVNLLKLIFCNSIQLNSRRIIERLFDFENTDYSLELINYYKKALITKDSLTTFYGEQFKEGSKTTSSLNRFLAKKYPDEFKLITENSTPSHKRITWNRNNLKLLNNQKQFELLTYEIIQYIKMDAPESINENGILRINYLYEHQLNEKFENSIILDFITCELAHVNLNTLTALFQNKKDWFIFIGRKIERYQENFQEELKPVVKSLQNFIEEVLPTIDWKSLHSRYFIYQDLEVQIPCLFKKGIIQLKLETAIQFLCLAPIHVHVSDMQTLDAFLIENYTLEVVKPYILEIFENPSTPYESIGLAIQLCSDFNITEVQEDVYDIFCDKDPSLKYTCMSYLLTINFSKPTLLNYVINNPTITESWHLSIFEYVYKDEASHQYLLKIVEKQINFVSAPSYINTIPSTLCIYGVRLGSYKCMKILFQYLEAKIYIELKFYYFENLEQSYPTELFNLSIKCLEIYKNSIRDHGDSIAGILGNIILNIASTDIEKFNTAIAFYDRLILENSTSNANIISLEWWKIRLTKKYQEKNSHYLNKNDAKELVRNIVTY